MLSMKMEFFVGMYDGQSCELMNVLFWMLQIFEMFGLLGMGGVLSGGCEWVCVLFEYLVVMLFCVGWERGLRFIG